MIGRHPAVQKQEPRPLSVIKSALGEMARAALSEPFMLAIDGKRFICAVYPKPWMAARGHLSDLQLRT